MFSESFDYFCFIIAAHLLLLVIDYILKWKAVRAYTSTLKKAGIGIQPLAVTWYAVVFNRTIHKIGCRWPKFQRTWFSCGTWITLFALPFAVYFVIQSTVVLFVGIVSKKDGGAIGASLAPYLEPAIPGVNIPMSDMGYYVGTLFLCSVFHELGHAVAAVREGVRINGVGLFLLCLVPIAYVRMEGLENLSTKKQLRVFCAGIWHNIALATLAFFFIFLLPWLGFAFYDYGNGVQVVSIRKTLFTIYATTSSVYLIIMEPRSFGSYWTNCTRTYIMEWMAFPRTV